VGGGLFRGGGGLKERGLIKCSGSRGGAYYRGQKIGGA